MNVLIVILASAAIFVAAYLTYGRFLSQKVFKLDDTLETPAVTQEDGLDYVPASKGSLLGQHFSAIAAAGPVNGPILAATMFGWLPALLWCIIGSIFIGGVHDMGSLVASVRNKATSITEVIKKHVSKRAWLLFMIFIWITLVYVIIAFTDITASSFVGNVTLENGESVLGGGIATSSILYLILPIIMGLCMKKFGLKEGIATAIFLPLVALSIWVGQYIPITLPFGDAVLQQKLWSVLILAYCLVASVMPMWLLLQPRGALGGYFLYAVLGVAAIGLVIGGFNVEYPAIVPVLPDAAPGQRLYPTLFITVACGACSGFHALVSSGTTSKQLRKDSDAKAVGYGAMLLEGMVAAVSIACVMIVPRGSEVLSKAPNFIYATGIGAFMDTIGLSAKFGISFGLMAFTTFVYDTLDVCTRLGRYILEELTGWKDLKGKIFSTILTAGVPIVFLFQTMTDASGKVVSAWSIFWGTFGASNQLLAALALVGISVFLKNTRKGFIWLVSFLPAIFMLIMSNWALINAIYTGWVLKLGHVAVPYVSVVLVILSILVAFETFYVMRKGSVVPAEA